MPRVSRRMTDTNTYHIMLRGINKQSIFESDSDKHFFVKVITKYKNETGFEIFAYCLMDNHVHILIRADNCILEKIFKKINTSYAVFYNKKYDRTGHLFQDRYRSEAINSDAQLLQTLKYIHYNPLKAGMCKDLEQYDFSSYKDYLYRTENDLVDTGLILDIVGGIEGLMEFHNEVPACECMDIDNVGRCLLSDCEAASLMLNLIPGCNPVFFQSIDKKERNEYIRIMKCNRLPVKQISRLTGVSLDVIKKVQTGEAL